MLKTFVAVLAANIATLALAFMLLNAYVSTESSWAAVDRANEMSQRN